MQQLAPDLWISDAPLRFLGLPLGARMTIVRLPGERLFVHSPVEAKPELLREVERLGSVAFLVAPNKFHHLSLGDWQRAFPEASSFVAPGLDEKRSDLRVTGVLGDAPETGWAETVDQLLLHGIPMINEAVFFHRPSATLIATDLAFNVGEESPASTQLFFRMAGTHGKLSPTLLERLLVRDRPAFAKSLERILDWPFERVIVAHGAVSEHGGREDLVRGYGWLLGD